MDPDEVDEVAELVVAITQMELDAHEALIAGYAERFPEIAGELWRVHEDRCEWYWHRKDRAERGQLDWFTQEKQEFRQLLELFQTVRPAVSVDDLTDRCERLISAAQYCTFNEAPYHIFLEEAIAAVWHLLEKYLQ